MLEKLITNLKQSLPGGAGKNAAGGNSVPESASAAPGKNKVSVQAAMAAAASGEEDAKKRNSMIVKVIVICGMAYLAVDEFLLKEETPVEVVAPKIRKKPKKQMDAAPENTENKVAENQPSSRPMEEASLPTSEPAPVENINVLSKDNNPIATPPAAEETTSRVGEVNLDQKIDQIAQEANQNQMQMQAQAQVTSPGIEEVKIPSQAPTSEAPQRDTSMASKIVEDAVETPAPAYDQVGRGLVYNCKGKHWACLNKPAYLECNKNMKWNQSKGNPAECVVQDIYNSDEDCAKVQTYNTTQGTPTQFCN